MIATGVNPVDALASSLGEGRPWAGVSDFLSAVRLLRKIPTEVARSRAVATIRVAVLGNATTDYLVDAIELALTPRLACATYVAGYDQWPQELLASGSGLDQFGPDVVVLLLSTLGLTAGGARYDEIPDRLVHDALAAFAARSNAPVVMVLPDIPVDATGGESAPDRWYQRARVALHDAAREALGSRSVTVDPMAVLADLTRSWRAGSYWGSAKLPYHAAGCIAVGRRVAQTIENITHPRVKVVAVDCDDTLWGGLAGEVGPSGVNLSPFDGGIGHLCLQRLLKEASANGILLVAVSKNEPETVAAVFRERARDMVLSADDFVAFKVGWGAKSHSLREVAAELLLGLDAFVFLDDSTFERGEVRAGTPEVFVPELPSNPIEYAPFVTRLGILERPIRSDEDARRTQLYQQERWREEARTVAASPDAYLASLDLQLIAAPIDDGSLDRVAQLVAKTNQFNLTTRRYSREELRALATDPSAYTYAFRVIDRFGDAGLIGVVIATTGGDEAVLDAFLMSCRVMARTVEHAMFEHLRRWLLRGKHSRIRASYIRSSKNALVAELLPQFGFTILDASPARTDYTREVDAALDVRFVSIREDS